MQQIKAQCKFCKREITLEIHPSYDAVADPFKLVPLAACNRCSDLRVRRKQLEERVRKGAIKMLSKKKMTPESLDKHRETFIVVTKQYTALIAEWLHAETPFWDIACVDLLMDHPEKWATVLTHLWKMYDQNY